MVTLAHILTARTAHVQTDVLLNELVWDLWLVTAGWQWSFTGSKPVSFQVLISGFSKTGRMIMVLRLLRLDTPWSSPVKGGCWSDSHLKSTSGPGWSWHLMSWENSELCWERGVEGWGQWITVLLRWQGRDYTGTNGVMAGGGCGHNSPERHSRGSGRCKVWSVHWSDVHMKLWSAPASFAVKILRATYNATISEVRRKGKHGSVWLFLSFFLDFLLDGMAHPGCDGDRYSA